MQKRCWAVSGSSTFFNIHSEAPEFGTTVFITEKTEISSVGESLRELRAKNKKLKKNNFFLSALAGNRSLEGIEGIKCMVSSSFPSPTQFVLRVPNSLP